MMTSMLNSPSLAKVLARSREKAILTLARLFTRSHETNALVGDVAALLVAVEGELKDLREEIAELRAKLDRASE